MTLSAYSLAAACAVPLAAQPVWQTPPLLHARWEHAMTYDPIGQRVLLVSGSQSTGGRDQFQDLWQLRGDEWERIGTGLALDSATFDPVRQRLVGIRRQGSFGGDLFEWDSTAWQSVTLPSSLFFLSTFGLTWDPARGAVAVLGIDARTNRSELWEWTGQWTLRHATSTLPWSTFRLVPDGVGGLLFVAYDHATSTMGTWSFGGSAWQRLAVAAPTLPDFDLVSEPVTGVPVVVGQNGAGLQTWVWRGGAWLQLFGASPPPRRGARLAAQPDVGGRVILFGGVRTNPFGTGPEYLGDTWALTTSGWQLVRDTESPGRVLTPKVTYDAGRGRTVLHAFPPGAGWQTWEHDGRRWQPRASTVNLGFAGPIAADPRRGRTVMLQSDGATWEWDGNWTPVLPPGSGPQRWQAAMAFDGQGVILFGGVDAVTRQPSDATFRYDGVAWTRLTPAASPSARVDHLLAFDAARGRVVMAGPRADVWEWDANTWTRVTDGPWAEDRARFVFGFAPTRGRVVFASGEAIEYRNGAPYTVARSDAFEWDGAVWRTLPAVGTNYVGGAGVALPDGDFVLIGDKVPDQRVLRHTAPATVAMLGRGCSGTTGTPGIDVPPWSRAWLGATLAGRVTAVPPATTLVVLALGTRNDQWQGVSLPFDLAPIGAPGCPLRVGPDLAHAWPAVAAQAAFGYLVPSNPSLLGLRLHLQAIVPDAAANAAGLTMSDAVTVQFGAR